MYPVVDASYLMSSSPPQFRCLNCSASQVCPQDGPLYQKLKSSSSLFPWSQERRIIVLLQT
uniref:Polycomb group ring finger 5 n=1 Tax=Molossus molossus TaxID=27622 RepID=A0A7J8DQR3_MOLMO|nr:polycomb group ring finger 5 [Molossus molossus]